MKFVVGRCCCEARCHRWDCVLHNVILNIVEVPLLRGSVLSECRPSWMAASMIGVIASVSTETDDGEIYYVELDDAR